VFEESGEIAPGSGGFVQLRFESPVVTLPNERFIIRSYSPSRTIAGGFVLDSFSQKHRGRERAQARERLVELTTADRAEEISIFIEMAGSPGMRVSDLKARTGLRDEALAAAISVAIERNAIVDAGGVFLSRASFDDLCERTVDEVAEHHRNEPLSRGLLRETLRERQFTHTSAEVFRAVLAGLERVGSIVSEKEIVRSGEHSLALSSTDSSLRGLFEKIYRDSGIEVLTIDEAMQRAGVQPSARTQARKVFQLVIDAGEITRIGTDLFMHHATLTDLVAKVRAYGDENEPDRLIDVAGFKNLAGVSRKYAIPLLEFLDREHVTRRVGDKRVIERVDRTF
jgi:selenocysteine-specific elongation factor